MVLDTNVKKFKYSFINKFICIVICIAVLMGSVGTIGVIVAANYVTGGDKIVDDYYKSEYLVDSFSGDIYSKINDSISAQRNKFYEDAYNANEEQIVNELFDDLTSAFDTENERFTRDTIKADFQWQEQDIEFSLFIGLIEENDEDDSYDYYDNIDSFSYLYDLTQSNPEKVKAIIKGQRENILNSEVYYLDDYDASKSFMLTTVFYGSLSQDEIARAKESPVFIIYNDHEIQASSQYSEREVQRLVDTKTQNGILNSNSAFCAYLDTSKYGAAYEYEDLMALYTGEDLYNQGYMFFPTAHNVMEKLSTYIAIAVVLSILFIVSLVCVIRLAGRKNDSDSVKLLFIDYVPFGIHIAVFAAIIAGVFTVATYSGGIIGYLTATMLFALCAGLLLIELLTSIARFCKSEKKLYTGFLTYYIVIIGKKALNYLKKPLKKIYALLSYKPKTFVRNVIIITAIYALANIISLLLLNVLILNNHTLIFIVLACLYVAGNIYVFIEILKYIKNLDTIIQCAQEKQITQLDVDNLPQSLKTLAQSLKYTNEELENAISKAVKDERLKTELITNVTHDLKTPLTSIITYVDLLSKCDIEDGKAQEYIKVLDEKGAKLKRLIDDLIEATKVTTGNVTVNATLLNLNELCLQATGESQADFEKAGLELIVEANEKPIVFADGAKAYRIMENLLSNARKYSTTGSRVYVNVYQEDGYGVFEIKNISAQQLNISPDELVQRFVRGDESRNQEGNGLGLSIAKELCTIQKGELEIIIDGDLFKARVKLPLGKSLIVSQLGDSDK